LYEPTSDFLLAITWFELLYRYTVLVDFAARVRHAFAIEVSAAQRESNVGQIFKIVSSKFC